MKYGTIVHFLWESWRPQSTLVDALDSFWENEKATARAGDPYRWDHSKFGEISASFREDGAGGADSIRLGFWECGLLPAFAYKAPESRKPEVICRGAYHLVKRLFLHLDADLCAGSVVADQLIPFDFEDSCIFRLFRFTRDGPQKLIRPYEENRMIRAGVEEPDEVSDLAFSPTTGEPNWVMHVEGPLPVSPAKNC